uniref:Ribosomal protein S14p/S29e/SSN2 fusion protein n=2 Tax=Brassica TaxID=3705 RepID=A0A068F507_BRANA|nr:suppressor of SNI1 2 [Brassica napus]AID60153.1 ribosomal protein S14p/S29e/SSN2 fusion protein [Brassica napus]
MGFAAIWNSHPKKYGPGSRTCRVCGNSHGLIRKYGLNCCRQCFRSNAKEIGFIKPDQKKLNLESSLSLGKMSVTLLVADTVWSNIESTGSVTEEQLSILHLLFGKNLEKATRIIDKRGVKKISGLPSGRSIFQVVGESQKREEYLCFPGDYCGCYSFFYDVVSRGEQQCCKHQLAARMASSLGAYSEIEVSDEHLAVMLSKI